MGARKDYNEVDPFLEDVVPGKNPTGYLPSDFEAVFSGGTDGARMGLLRLDRAHELELQF